MYTYLNNFILHRGNDIKNITHTNSISEKDELTSDYIQTDYNCQTREDTQENTTVNSQSYKFYHQMLLVNGNVLQS